jgi:hypothetical protein
MLFSAIHVSHELHEDRHVRERKIESRWRLYMAPHVVADPNVECHLQDRPLERALDALDDQGGEQHHGVARWAVGLMG